MHIAVVTIQLIFGVYCVLAILPQNTDAAALNLDDRSLETSSSEEADDIAVWATLIQNKIRREMEELNAAESRIVQKMKALNAERQNIIAQKRGHRPCLVSVVACYRKRK